MTDNNHPITPPDELVEDWWEATQKEKPEKWVRHLATQAARWGADMELEACCEWLLNSAVDGAKTLEPYIAADPETFINAFRAARRPKPPSLKEQALEALKEADQGLNESEWRPRSNTIRRALEQLDD